MKICVFGAGAIGGLIAGRLATRDHEVSVVARGAHLAAIQKRGLIVRSGGTEQHCRIPATANAEEFGVQDCVIIAVKAAGLTHALPGIAPLLGPSTTVIPAMNGVPWWFFSGFGGVLEGMALPGVDPGGKIASAIGIHRVLGCVVYPTAHIAEPGVIQHTGRSELYLGEPDGTLSDRVQTIQVLLSEAGFACKATSEIRREIWAKLIGNASFNPVSALTCATLDRMLDEPFVYELLRNLMAEVIAVGKALGLSIDETPETRLERGRPLGAVKFSMLQDVEHGRPFEFEALSGAVVLIAERLGIPTPALRDVHALIKLRAQTLSSTLSSIDSARK